MIAKRPAAGAGAPVMGLDVVAFGAPAVVVINRPVPILNGVKRPDLRHGLPFLWSVIERRRARPRDLARRSSIR
jgi:hypothetical protein